MGPGIVRSALKVVAVASREDCQDEGKDGAMGRSVKDSAVVVLHSLCLLFWTLFPVMLDVFHPIIVT